MVFLGARFFGVLGTAAQSVTMGWQVYDVARADRGVDEAALLVGLLGLSTFIPLFLLALPAGLVADRLPRREVLLACFAGEAACAGALLVAAALGQVTVPVLLAVAVAFGAARAFRAPAGSALAPMLVAPRQLPLAIAWSSLAFQLGTICGPALAGVVVGRWTAAHCYAVVLALNLVPIAGLLTIRRPTRPPPATGSRLEAVREGLAYVWREKVVLGAMSLDLFAVLLGGATALLPVFARDVLEVGPQGFGLLRSAPAVGAALTSLVLATRPLARRAGATLFLGVGVYGVATVVFGLSTHLWLSVGALATLGAADMVSVYVRQTLMQVATPDAMRGRVASVSYLFIGASNELGEFESGVTARLLGPVGAAVFGGLASLGITAVWARLFPELRRADRLH